MDVSTGEGVPAGKWVAANVVVIAGDRVTANIGVTAEYDRVAGDPLYAVAGVASRGYAMAE